MTMFDDTESFSRPSLKRIYVKENSSFEVVIVIFLEDLECYRDSIVT